MVEIPAGIITLPILLLMKLSSPFVSGSSNSKEGSVNSQSATEDRNAQKKIQEALEMSKDVSRLMEAADLLEEVVTSNPTLREKYEYRLKLWRRGITI